MIEQQSPVETLTSQAAEPVLAESASGNNFNLMVAKQQERFAALLAEHGPHLYSTKTKGLSSVYRGAFPEAEQQHHNCHCCRSFLNEFGGAVFIAQDGRAIPALWDESVAIGEYADSVKAVLREINKTGVQNVLLTIQEQWGQPVTGQWTHLWMPAQADAIRDEQTLVPCRAGFNLEATLLTKAVDSFSREVLAVAINALKALGKGGERWLPQIEWLWGVQERLAAIDKVDGERRRKNLILRETRLAPSSSFACIANNVEGTSFLEEIAKGVDVDQALNTFLRRTAPDVYRMKEAAATEGNIQVARKIFAEQGLGEDDLLRRLASISEVEPHFFWKPAPAPTQKAATVGDQLFAELSIKGMEQTKPKLDLEHRDGGPVSWAKFKADILPMALELFVRVPSSDTFVNFHTPIKPDAGRIFFFDHADKRQPISWNTTVQARSCATIGLIKHDLARVLGIVKPPALWVDDSPRAQKYDNNILLLEGVKEAAQGNLALFPELLRTDLREAERVIQLFGDSKLMDVSTENQAIGIEAIGTRIMVRTQFGRTEYTIDRAD